MCPTVPNEFKLSSTPDIILADIFIKKISECYILELESRARISFCSFSAVMVSFSKISFALVLYAGKMIAESSTTPLQIWRA